LKLYLLRHAKSSWDDPDLADHDRPLAPRGKRAADAMGRALAREGVSVDAVLCSSAKRAQATARRAFSAAVEVDVRPELYMATAREILSLIRQQEAGVKRLAVVGHNPGMHDLAVRLAGDGPSTEMARLRQKFPTGALAVLEFGGSDWTEAVPGKGLLVRFVRPKDLPDADRMRL
jgi:phosphohistidine phosphatase